MDEIFGDVCPCIHVTYVKLPGILLLMQMHNLPSDSSKDGICWSYRKLLVYRTDFVCCVCLSTRQISLLFIDIHMKKFALLRVSGAPLV